MCKTIDTEKLQAFFNNCPALRITEVSWTRKSRRPSCKKNTDKWQFGFKVDNRHVVPSQCSPDYMVAAVNTVASIHANQAPGDILVFATSKADVYKITQQLRNYTTDLAILPLVASHSLSDQYSVLWPATPVHRRRCIVTTAAAETSVALPGISYVVDTGLIKEKGYNPRLDMHMLQTRRISRASAVQRAGQVGGPMSNGVCFRLYTKQALDAMEHDSKPAIHSKPLHGAVLMLLAAGVTRPMDFDWIDRPHPEAFARAAQDLRAW